MLNKAKTIHDKLINLRRTIHKHPELGFQEIKTSALIANTLRELGIEFQPNVGKTGVVAHLGDGNGPKIGIRADMDALPILEANEVEYKSQVPGKMHACGHDSHTAMLLGVAMLLKDEPIAGEVRLLFQPAEEGNVNGTSGAQEMIKEHALDDLDTVIALHVNGTLDCGQIALISGYSHANTDRMYAKIIGKGGHGAVPHEAIDPIFMTAPILTAIHGIVSRRVNPIMPAVITVGRLAGGNTANVIPDTVELELTIRSTTKEVQKLLMDEIEKALSIARLLGGDYTCDVEYGYPALHNDEHVVRWIEKVGSDLLGSDNIKQRPLGMGGEDFSFMVNSCTGAMFSLGVKDPNGEPKYLHHSEFDIDENALPIGAALLAETALRFVRGELS